MSDSSPTEHAWRTDNQNSYRKQAKKKECTISVSALGTVYSEQTKPLGSALGFEAILVFLSNHSTATSVLIM